MSDSTPKLMPKAWQLWAVLADGARHHVRDVAASVGCEVQALYGLWKTVPPEVQSSLRQNDGWWQLKSAMAVVSPEQASAIGAASGFAVHAVAQTGSTNDDVWQAKSRSGDLHRYAVVALEQSQGRGRLARQWHNRIGQTLMFSLGWRVAHSSAAVGALPLACGLWVVESLAEQGVNAALKWPNDIVVGAKKLGGVLVESRQRGEEQHIVIGIGINIVPPTADELRDTATGCIAQNSAFSAAKLLQAILQRVVNGLPDLLANGFAALQDAYIARLRDIGQNVSLFERDKLLAQGKVVGIDAHGSLRLIGADGRETVYQNGEISLRPESATDAPANAPTAMHSAQAFQAPASARYVLLDGGNSQLKWAWVDAARQLHFGGRAPYANLQAFGEFMSRQAADVDILGCAVCGSKKMAAVEAAAARPVRWLSSMRHALGVTNHYYKVQQHGSDRWFNILGSRMLTENACVVVSCGTAITMDALTHDGHYLGGSIMPGFNLMKEAMASKTANLNQPIGKAYPFATSTPNALASGMHDAACGAVVLMHERLRARQAGQPVDIMLTGGGAGKIEQQLPRSLLDGSQVRVVDNLVLLGLQNWVEHTCNY